MHEPRAHPPAPLPPPPIRLTKQQAIDSALAHNPTIVIAREQVAQANARVTQATAFPDPTLGFTVQGVGRAINPHPAFETDIIAGFTIPFPQKFWLHGQAADGDVGNLEAAYRTQRAGDRHGNGAGLRLAARLAEAPRRSAARARTLAGFPQEDAGPLQRGHHRATRRREGAGRRRAEWRTISSRTSAASRNARAALNRLHRPHPRRGHRRGGHARDRARSRGLRPAPAGRDGASPRARRHRAPDRGGALRREARAAVLLSRPQRELPAQRSVRRARACPS